MLVIKKDDVEGKDVIEVGSKNDNGSLRPYIESLGPSSYIGVDIKSGPGVDSICRIEDLIRVFGRDRFDLVVNTEVLEHVRDWRLGVHNLKNIVKPGGAVIITTRSKGCHYHGHPFDFWRYDVNDMKTIFADMDIDELRTDPEMPGVFLCARKPQLFREADLSGHKIYSVLLRFRCPVVASTVLWRSVFLPIYSVLKLLYFFTGFRLLKNILKKNLKPDEIARLKSLLHKKGSKA